MWKILTAQIREEIYNSLISRRLFPEKQKGCRKETRDTGEQLYISPRREQNVWKKSSYGQPTKSLIIWSPQSWILHCLKMYKIPDEVMQVSIKSTFQVSMVCSINYRADHGNLESGFDRNRKRLIKGKDPERHIPGKCTITITICNSDDTTQSHSQEMHRWIQTSINRKKRSTTM